MMDSRTVLLELAYGSPANVDRDVDLFEGFYLAHCAEEALARMVQRKKRRSLALGACLCVAACLLAVPMAMNPSSIFAVILLLMGGGLLVAGALFLWRAAQARAYCGRRFRKLMDAEFAGTRSVTKRVFDVRFTEEGMTVSFGTKTAVKQTRSKAYADISAVYATDELVFVKGLTWMSRFQLGDEPFERSLPPAREGVSRPFRAAGSRAALKAGTCMACRRLSGWLRLSGGKDAAASFRVARLQVRLARGGKACRCFFPGGKDDRYGCEMARLTVMARRRESFCRSEVRRLGFSIASSRF